MYSFTFLYLIKFRNKRKLNKNVQLCNYETDKLLQNGHFFEGNLKGSVVAGCKSMT